VNLGPHNQYFATPPHRTRFERRIYIPLPDPNARARMFALNIGQTPCKITQNDLRLLAQKTEGFSGSDIGVMVRDAIMEPVRKVQLATHFKRVMAPSRSDASQITQHWLPCSPGDAEGTEMTWADVQGEELLEPPVTVSDFIKASVTARPSVNQGDLEQYEKWTEEFGQEA
jgi:vacuolar protein-sorting-associated protein 4